jgi:integrase
LPARNQIAKLEHYPAMPYAEVPAFIAELRKQNGVAPRALEFTILTAARTGEVIKAEWSEIDFDTKVWTRPAAHTKTEREHRVPLSDRAIELLKNKKLVPREEGNPFIFIGQQPGAGLSHMALDQVLKRIAQHGVTVHGFRSSFRDWGAECTAYPNNVLEMALAHTIGNKVEAAYRRGELFDKRKRLMSDWSRYCAAPKQNGAAVIPMRGRNIQ